MGMEKHSTAINTTARFAGVDHQAVREVLAENSPLEFRPARYATALRTVARFAGISEVQAIVGITRQPIPGNARGEAYLHYKAA